MGIRTLLKALFPRRQPYQEERTLDRFDVLDLTQFAPPEAIVPGHHALCPCSKCGNPPPQIEEPEESPVQLRHIGRQAIVPLGKDRKIPIEFVEHELLPAPKRRRKPAAKAAPAKKKPTKKPLKKTQSAAKKK